MTGHQKLRSYKSVVWSKSRMLLSYRLFRLMAQSQDAVKKQMRNNF